MSPRPCLPESFGGLTAHEPQDPQYTASLFYQRYFYNADIAALTNKLSLAPNFIPKNKSLQTVFETVSVFSKSILGVSFDTKLTERFAIKADWFRTTYQRDESYTDMLIPRITANLTDSLDAYLQADLVLTEPQSQLLTLSFQYTWRDSWSSELGVSQSRSAQEKSWSLLLTLSFAIDDSSNDLKAGNQNQ